MTISPFGKRLPVRDDSKLIIPKNAHHSCRMCASGCRNYDIMLTEQESRRLSLNMWRPLLNSVSDDMPLVVLDSTTGQYMLNKVDGRCVFLDTDNLCIIHKSA